MDEITSDLDLFAREGILNFLRAETETRGATIFYCSWAFHLTGFEPIRNHPEPLSTNLQPIFNQSSTNLQPMPDYALMQTDAALQSIPAACARHTYLRSPGRMGQPPVALVAGRGANDVKRLLWLTADQQFCT